MLGPANGSCGLAGARREVVLSLLHDSEGVSVPLCGLYITIHPMPQQHPPPKPPPSFMSSLIHQAQTSIPKEFQLPDDVRNFFKDGASLDGRLRVESLTINELVATGSNGSYMDSSEIRQPRLK